MTEHTVRPIRPAQLRTAQVPPAPLAPAQPARARAGRSAAWSLVLPLKPLALAKSRLDPYAGAHRADLALAFALDTVTAALNCPAVAQVLVVSRDPVAGPRLAGLGAVLVTDEPTGHPGEGLNPALAHGAAHARRLRPDAPLAALSADLPALRPAELARVLGAVPAGARAFLADAPGQGTTLLACAAGRQLEPAFGGASRQRHALGGALELALPDVPSVRRDVDTGADLAEALLLGVGPHTRRVAAALV
ncbi:2-phospho-L-lactate guanylyltransferase [Kitasatospora sp. NBC_01250]|uniref:2-phospho-L-lactate guanylyltransferase n=1 Tax=unclassified Kitasatospora TaxID=2633591 RepID=UPI002E14C4CB|nr:MULTISPECIES: 2-phospho-L-lactate guanylyltransferase [unclassified Kitasatospora]WSJ69385.1 2-phospho-L-lactate guanylyltransferase [Kitasatospora sp. NBC_01302]